ncbi:MAG: alpha-1,2-fucosyltransferase [Sphingobacteriaceae bacterium]|nr:MAG: alpha-1,2-fucosyltransferase [Sphingobacteriaceae bacterium]
MQVVVKINGGLGNQMFQYAAGRATSLRFNSVLQIETIFFKDILNEGEHKRQYQLNIFPNIAALDLQEISPKNRHKQKKYINSSIYKAENSLRGKLGIKLAYQHIWEKNLLTYDPSFQQSNKKAHLTYLIGDWQNEQYFESVAAIIRNDFSFPTIESGSLNADILSQIYASEAVAVHVRRGDYLLPGIHSPVSPAYYQEALSLIRSKVASPKFFVFSDDINWCRANLGLADACFVEHNTGTNNYRDMQLMSSCKHNIIANSSFSWWGAWLNNNPTKIVIAPSMWMPTQAVESSRVVPLSWITL